MSQGIRIHQEAIKRAQVKLQQAVLEVEQQTRVIALRAQAIANIEAGRDHLAGTEWYRNEQAIPDGLGAAADWRWLD